MTSAESRLLLVEIVFLVLAALTAWRCHRLLQVRDFDPTAQHRVVRWMSVLLTLTGCALVGALKLYGILP
jgi:hypothetical protein